MTADVMSKILALTSVRVVWEKVKFRSSLPTPASRELQMYDRDASDVCRPTIQKPAFKSDECVIMECGTKRTKGISQEMSDSNPRIRELLYICYMKIETRELRERLKHSANKFVGLTLRLQNKYGLNIHSWL